MKYIFTIIYFILAFSNLNAQLNHFNFEKSDNLLEEYISHLKINKIDSIIIFETTIGKNINYSIIKNFIFKYKNDVYYSFYSNFTIENNKKKLIILQNELLENFTTEKFDNIFIKLNKSTFNDLQKPFKKAWKKRKWRNIILIDDIKNLTILNRSYNRTSPEYRKKLFKQKRYSKAIYKYIKNELKKGLIY